MQKKTVDAVNKQTAPIAVEQPTDSPDYNKINQSNNLGMQLENFQESFKGDLLNMRSAMAK